MTTATEQPITLERQRELIARVMALAARRATEGTAAGDRDAARMVAARREYQQRRDELIAEFEQQHAYWIAALGQHPRRDEPIAAVVPWAGDDRHARAQRLTRYRISNRTPGFLHQHNTRSSANDGQTVALAHFLGCQQFDHWTAQ